VEFLTGEREADPRFYSEPAEQMYGMNRQVWKLKEYELPNEPYQTAFNGDLDGSAVLSGTGDTYSNPSVIGGFVATPLSPSSSSSGSVYEPLTEGKWTDGWLPPAEALQWRFPDDCGDELEIVESIVVGGDPSSTRRESGRVTLESSLQGSFSSSSKGGDDEDSIGWEKEKVGVSGRLRGRRNRNEAPESELAVGEASTSKSITPVGGKNSRVVDGAASPRFLPPQHTDTLSPKSPEFDTALAHAIIGADGRRRETGVDEYSFEDVRVYGPSRTGTGEFGAKAPAANDGPRVVEKVSRYVRWDPNVVWARQAIWGSVGVGIISPSGHDGKIRGSHVHAPSTSSKNKGGEWPVGKVRRQIRDILIFGEVRWFSERN